MNTMQMMEPMLDCEAAMRQIWDYLGGVGMRRFHSCRSSVR